MTGDFQSNWLGFGVNGIPYKQWHKTDTNGVYTYIVTRETVDGYVNGIGSSNEWAVVPEPMHAALMLGCLLFVQRTRW